MNAPILATECPACRPGEEQTETFYSATFQREMVNYDYRTPEGVLFSMLAPSIAVARIYRDRWLQPTEPRFKIQQALP